jgi:RNA polymerase sigma-70 factor (family 1)
VSNFRLSAKSSPPSDTASNAEGRFDALVRAHYSRLCNFAARFLQSDEVVEDIVQDVFLAIWKKHTEFDFDDPLPYLYQAVRNRVVMHARQRRVRDEWQQREQASIELPMRGDAADTVETTELTRELSAAINALPEGCRLVFTMSREQDLTYPEIARALGISVKTVEGQMSRALRSLRLRLADYLSVGVIAAALSRFIV